MAPAEGLAEHISAFAHDELVSIQLETCDQNLTVSKALLCSASDYFKKALTGKFAESSTRTLHVPGCDLETFQLFLYWITNGKQLKGTPHPAVESPLHDRHCAEQNCHSQISLSRLWIFADAYLMPELQNTALDVLIRLCSHADVQVGAVEYVFAHTAENSVLRTVYVAGVRKKLIKNTYTEADVDRLVSIPDFFQCFRRTSRQCETVVLECTCED